jgi:HPr kinase/phosphorylase
VRLELDKGDGNYDRIGLEDHLTKVLGVELPEIVLPLRPGRNVAVLLEVAALNQRLKHEGVYSAKELNQKLIAKMAESKH